MGLSEPNRWRMASIACRMLRRWIAEVRRWCPVDDDLSAKLDDLAIRMAADEAMYLVCSRMTDENTNPN